MTGRLNEVGDLVLTDARALRAAADPNRLALFDAVRRNGSATAARLAELVGRDVDADLRELEAAGFVDRDDDGRWSTAAKGIYFEIPAEPGDAQDAARELAGSMIASYAALPETWARESEPQLDLEWARAAGLFNARVALTPGELRAVQEELERVLAPFTTRVEAPPDAEQVRVLAFFLPEAS